MKYMNNKNKNSTKSHILNSLLKEWAKDQYFLIYDSKNETINGVPVKELEEKLKQQPKLPDGYVGACYLHDKPLYFKDLKKMKQHELDKHRVWKG